MVDRLITSRIALTLIESHAGSFENTAENVTLHRFWGQKTQKVTPFAGITEQTRMKDTKNLFYCKTFGNGTTLFWATR